MNRTQKLIKQWKSGIIPENSDLEDIIQILNVMFEWLKETGDSNVLLSQISLDRSRAIQMLKDRQ